MTFFIVRKSINTAGSSSWQCDELQTTRTQQDVSIKKAPGEPRLFLLHFVTFGFRWYNNCPCQPSVKSFLWQFIYFSIYVQVFFFFVHGQIEIVE